MPVSESARERVRRLAHFDLANLLVDAREAIHDELQADQRNEAERMLDRWEAMLNPELETWAPTARELASFGSRPSAVQSFVRQQGFRQQALGRLSRAVIEDRSSRIRRWRFAAVAYRRTVGSFLERWSSERALEREEEELEDRVGELAGELRFPVITTELARRWSRDDPPFGARVRRADRSRDLLQRIERREERQERLRSQRARLRDDVVRWLGEGAVEDLPGQENLAHQVAVLRRLVEERETRRAERTARAVRRGLRQEVRSSLGANEDGPSLLRQLESRLGTSTD